MVHSCICGTTPTCMQRRRISRTRHLKLSEERSGIIMSNKTAVLERPQSHDARFGVSPLETELPEEDADDSFEREPSDDLLNLYETDVVSEDSFQEDDVAAVVLDEPGGRC